MTYFIEKLSFPPFCFIVLEVLNGILKLAQSRDWFPSSTILTYASSPQFCSQHYSGVYRSAASTSHSPLFRPSEAHTFPNASEKGLDIGGHYGYAAGNVVCNLTIDCRQNVNIFLFFYVINKNGM